ncbi:hypothetical protein GCM10009122_00570 [Fulvivirga kasyanovii]|uniref:Tetratricopeptide repeat protein n=1 Tax=Fulvivirga kasyanovii TaxID=396812 RepID=A0ABW9RM55_9BACT|nr:hypothetical protein [Fulvivirga kasyanovii]MTI25179.1 hypothetical protein [Fulvivirga kasyanovii]
MMKSLKQTLLICLLIAGINEAATAQLNLPEDEALSKKAQNEHAMFSDSFKFKKTTEARKHLAWLLSNTPEIHESIYINGIKLYQDFAEDESNPKAQVYQDSVMLLYDLRIKYFNNEKDLIDRKASAAYKYYRNRDDKTLDLFNVFERTYELNQKDVGTNNLATYMDVTRKYHKIKPLTKDDILDRYYRVIDAIDYKEQQGGDGETFEKVRAVATKILLEIIDIDCNVIKNDLVPRMRKDPKMTPRVISLSLSQGCTNEPYFEEAAKILMKDKPDYALLRFLAIKAAEKGNMEEAMQYFNRAIEATNDPSKKAQIHYDIAVQHNKVNNKPEARRYAEKAVETDANFKKAYKLIGDLYYSSFNDCKKEESWVSDRAVYWLAYDMYQKAGDQDAMRSAETQFPTISDIFTENREEGQTINVNCWINRSTTIRRRKE